MAVVQLKNKSRKLSLKKRDLTGPRGIDGKDGLHGTAGAAGRDGKDGAVGKPGATGERGLDGLRGAIGEQGTPGKDGISPKPEQVAEVLKKDEEFIEATKGKDAESQGWVSGSTNPVRYEAITNSEYDIKSGSLIDGMNIYGVQSVPATIYLPTNIRTSQLIVINDETGSAGTSNITVTTR